MKQMASPERSKAILEVHYRTTAHWAHPIRRAIDRAPALAKQDERWGTGAISDYAFAIETRLRYLPQIITFLDDHLAILNSELRRGGAKGHLQRGHAFSFRNEKALQRVLFGTTAFITESRACFENLAAFYREFLRTYFDQTIGKKAAYEVVTNSTKDSAWADALRRIRGDVIHQRSLFLAFVDEAGWPPIFSMNWRPGQFGLDDRIEFQTLVKIWEGLHAASRAMQAKIVETVRTGCAP
jgi:hypothetical protein